MKPFDYVEIRVPAKPQYVSVARLLFLAWPIVSDLRMMISKT